MAYPKLLVNLQKISHNARTVVHQCSEHGIDVWGVTKVLSGEPRVGQAMLSGGVKYLADSRLVNLKKLRQAGYTNLVLLRVPMLSEAEEVITVADISLVSEKATLLALNEAASQRGIVHKVVLMIDLGDLREGIYYQDALSYYGELPKLSHIRIIGLGTNLTCYGAVIPTPGIIAKLVALREEMEKQMAWELDLISGGNSSSFMLLWQGLMPTSVNNLRIGEGIILGRETTAQRQQIPGAFIDTCIVQAEIVELQCKPSLPEGETGEDAFGNKPIFEDRGKHDRAILAIGRQDVDPDGLEPVDSTLEILGASSDHLLLAMPNEHNYKVGDIVEFIPSYSALLRLSTSPYVEKQWIN